MKKWGTWLVLALALVLAGLIVGAGLFALQGWIGTDDFKARAQEQAGVALGVPLQLGRVEVDLWPVPALAVVDVLVGTRPALTLERVEVRPVLAGLLTGLLELASLLVRRADLPQAGIDQVLAAQQKQPAAAGPAPDHRDRSAGLVIPRRLVLDAVTWRSAGGDATTVDADANLGPDGLPDTLALKVLAGRLQGARDDRRIGVSNALFLPHGTPNTAAKGRNTAPDTLESVFGCRLRPAGDLLGVDVIPCLRDASFSPAATRTQPTPAALLAGSPELSRLVGLRPLAAPGHGLAPEAAPRPADPSA